MQAGLELRDESLKDQLLGSMVVYEFPSLEQTGQTSLWVDSCGRLMAV